MNILFIADASSAAMLSAAGLFKWGYSTARFPLRPTTPQAQPHSTWTLLHMATPWTEGLELIGRLRHANERLGILVTANGCDARDAVEAYHRGADLVMNHPIAHDQMMAAVDAQIRWQLLARHSDEAEQHSGLEIDSLNMVLIGPHGPVALTASECRLMMAFAHSDSGMLKIKKICEVLGYDSNDSSRLSVMVYRTRQKLTAVGMDKKVLRAHRSMGYELTCRVTVR